MRGAVMFIQVLFFFTDALGDDIRDVKPPVDWPANAAYLFILAGIILFMVAVFLIKYFCWRYKKNKALYQTPKSPWQLAYERLEALKGQNYPALGQVKEYYYELSDIIRHYLEDRFSMKAPEMTTPEFLWFLKGSNDLIQEHKELLSDFLNSCDMVKFAKYGSSIKEMEEGFLSAKKLIDETKLAHNALIYQKK